MTKSLAYRKTGVLNAMTHDRSFIASQIKGWRKAGKVRRFILSDLRAYQAESSLNPYVAYVARS